MTIGVKLVTQLTNRGLSAKRVEQWDRHHVPQNAFLVNKKSQNNLGGAKSPPLMVENAHTIHYMASGLCPGLPGWASTRTNLDFTETRCSEWQWHQLCHMQICTSPRQITMPASHHSVFLQSWCHSCYPTNSIKSI